MSLPMRHRSPADVKWRELRLRKEVFARSLDDLICPPQHRRRDRQAEGLGGLEVDHQLELCRLLDGQVARVRALQDLVDENGNTSVEHGKVHAVRDEGSGFREWPQIVDRGLTMLERERCELLGVDKPQSGANEEGTRASFT